MEADFGKMIPSSRKKGGGDAFENGPRFICKGTVRRVRTGTALLLYHTPVALIEFASSSLPVKVHLKKKFRGRKTRL
jgi:hypothetical protein